MPPSTTSSSSSSVASHGNATPPPAGEDDLNELAVVMAGGQQESADFHDNYVDNYNLDVEAGGNCWSTTTAVVEISLPITGLHVRLFSFFMQQVLQSENSQS